MSLATLPSAAVVVTVASADPATATVAPASLTFTASNWNTAQSVTINGTDDADMTNDTATIALTATNGGYSAVTAGVAVTVTDDDTATFTDADADAYVCARDSLVSSLNTGYYISGHGDAFYPADYQDQVAWVRSNSGCNVEDAIPLGENDPNSLPNPRNQEALKDAIDALAVAAGLTQAQIDAAEGG